MAARYADALINPPAGNSNPSLVQRMQQEEKPDINQDIQVTKEHGPWMVMVHAYTGPEASLMARQMVMELREAYKLSAHTFNFGAEEKRKEIERVKGIIEKQKEYLARNGMPLDQPVRIRTMHIEEQVGVLVGGYPNEDAARRVVDQLHKVKPPDPNKVMLDKKIFYMEEKKEKGSGSQTTKAVEAYVNPFLGAFVVHNPRTKQERPADWDKLDMGLLQRLNRDESFSLLHCKKQYTLAVKDFKTPTMVQARSAGGSFLEALGMGGKSGQRIDAAAESAHNFAELLRKAKLEAYVLHTKYTSFVTVGGYDSTDDPAMRSMANTIETKLMPQISQLFPLPPNQSMSQAKVLPMQIPR